MNNVEKGIRIRFVEHDYLYKKIKTENPYIRVKDIVSMLEEQSGLCDLTFIFTPLRFGGFSTQIIDNIAEKTITLDDLNHFAFDFYVQQIEKLSLIQQQARNNIKEKQELEAKAQACINKIKNMMLEWKSEKVVAQ